MDVNKEGGKTIFLQVMTNIPLPVIFLPHEKRIIFGVFERNYVLNGTKHTPGRFEKINLVLLTLRNGRRNGKGFFASRRAPTGLSRKSMEWTKNA